MGIIKYNGRKFSTRTFDAYLADESEDDAQTITIASSDLSDAFGDDIEVVGSEAETIDKEIYFYVDAEHFNDDAETICREHLDEPFVFVTEYK